MLRWIKFNPEMQQNQRQYDVTNHMLLHLIPPMWAPNHLVLLFGIKCLRMFVFGVEASAQNGKVISFYSCYRVSR